MPPRRFLWFLLLPVGLASLVPAAQGSPKQAPSQLHLVNETFKCSNYPQPVNFDLVKVTIRAGLPQKRDAVHLSGTGSECTGRIGRLEVDTWSADGVKVHREAHDLTIDGGYIRCHDKQGEVHQDGIQAMGGTRVTFRNMEVDCATANNSAMFLSSGKTLVTEVVCDGCVLKKGPHRNRVLRIHESLRSGARNSTIIWCGRGGGCGGGGPVVVTDAAREPVNEGNRFFLHGSDIPASVPPTTPTGPLAIRSFKVTPVVAGKPFTVRFRVTGKANSLRLTCRATVKKRVLISLRRSLTGRMAACTWRAPARRGSLVTARVAVSNGEKTVRKLVTRRVLR